MALSYQEMAEKIVAEGEYIGGNKYERMLEKALSEEKKAELGDELQAYLTVEVSDALDRMLDLQDEGMDSRQAEELVLNDLLQTQDE